MKLLVSNCKRFYLYPYPGKVSLLYSNPVSPDVCLNPVEKGIVKIKTQKILVKIKTDTNKLIYTLKFTIERKKIKDFLSNVLTGRTYIELN